MLIDIVTEFLVADFVALLEPAIVRQIFLDGIVGEMNTSAVIFE
jgi:hypothetical protein